MKQLSLALANNKRALAFGAVGLAVGGFIRGFLPPFVVDQKLLYDFLVGPPMAGIFAVLAATLAYISARNSTRVARENADQTAATARQNAERAEDTAKRNAERVAWWNRAEWALNLSLSTNEQERRIGHGALIALQTEATEVEAAMLKEVFAGSKALGAADHRTLDENADAVDNFVEPPQSAPLGSAQSEQVLADKLISIHDARFVTPKKETLSELCSILGIDPPLTLNVGSTIPRAVFEAAAARVGVDATGRMDVVAGRIAERAGLTWTADDWSSGSTVTAAGFSKVLESVKLIAPESRATDEGE